MNFKTTLPNAAGQGLAVCVLLAFGLASLPVHARLDFRWQHSFTEAEQHKLTSWINEVATQVECLVGPFPFDIQIRFYRRNGAPEPVPWANTRRTGTQGVNFYVDPSYSLNALRRDWTAPHEISHLILPYLGAENAWFAEGFASFMQNQVLQAMGVLDRAGKARRYAGSLARAQRNYQYPRLPFVRGVPRLRAQGNHPVVYWGGAVYFLTANELLVQQTGTSLLDVLRRYLACCRRDYASLPGLVRELDNISGASLLSAQLQRFQLARGFPDYRNVDLGL